MRSKLLYGFLIFHPVQTSLTQLLVLHIHCMWGPAPQHASGCRAADLLPSAEHQLWPLLTSSAWASHHARPPLGITCTLLPKQQQVTQAEAAHGAGPHRTAEELILEGYPSKVLILLGSFSWNVERFAPGRSPKVARKQVSDVDRHQAG